MARFLFLSFVVVSAAACSSADIGSIPGAGRGSASGAGGGAATTTGAAGDGSSPGAPGAPSSAPARTTGVIFLHGTGDQGDVADLKCDGTGESWRCVVQAAVDEYWLAPTIDSERTRSDGTKRPYAVLGCPLGSQTPWPNPTPVKTTAGGAAEPGSATCVGVEAARFLAGPDGTRGTSDDVTDVAIVTHSGGSNVVRYMLAQHSARPEWDALHAAARGFVALAPPTRGTYLADWVFRNGSLASVANGADEVFGGDGFYDDDGTDFIQTTKMADENRDPAKLVAVTKDIEGVPIYVGGGSYPDASGDDAKVDCGDGTETKALNVLHTLYLSETDPPTFRDGCSDGFIPCESAMALAEGDASRVIFGELDDGRVVGKTRYRAHNQSRRQCDDVDLDVRARVDAILDGSTAMSFEARRFVAADVRGLVASTATRIVATRVAGDRLEVDVYADAPATLGVRATAVNRATGTIASTDQTSARVEPGLHTFVLRAATSDVRDVILVRHDDATTLDVRP